MRDIYSAARVARIKTARDQRGKKKNKKKRQTKRSDAYLARRQALSTWPIILAFVRPRLSYLCLFTIANDLFAALANLGRKSGGVGRARARHGKSRTNGFNERDFRIRCKVFDLTTGNPAEFARYLV